MANGYVAVYRELSFLSILSLFCCNDDHTVARPCSPYRSSGPVLEYRDIVDIVGVDGTDVTIVRKIVDNDQGTGVGLYGRKPTDADIGCFCTICSDKLDTRSDTVEPLKDAAPDGSVQEFIVNSSKRACGPLFGDLVESRIDNLYFLDRPAAFFQNNLQLAFERCNRYFFCAVPHEADGKAVRRYRIAKRKLTVLVCLRRNTASLQGQRCAVEGYTVFISYVSRNLGIYMGDEQ